MPADPWLIVGSGIAGLYTAVMARRRGHRVVVLTKSSIQESNTRYAQGGIAAAIGPDDSPSLHLRDTIAAGAGLVDKQAAEILVTDAPERIADLVALGVPFDALEGRIALGREAAHSAARIVHAGGDATGLSVETALAGAARAAGVDVHEYTLVTALLVEDGRAAGVAVLDTRTGARRTLRGSPIVLASGGAGQLYRYTTNPVVATGDGIAVAFRAGAVLTDMEFIQFHPTALRLPGAPSFLISEAVRGEGAFLRTPDGRRFMPDRHPDAELAPRDVVARAIAREMRDGGHDHVLLDVTHLPAAHVVARFPHIYRTCLEYGLDITRQPVPVAPAAHYTMGGIHTSIWGETTLAGLFACGEVACTGVHGANRLASNSLLETVVFADRIVRRVAGDLPPSAAGLPPAPGATDLPARPAATAERPFSREALQRLMWDAAGIVRDGERLGRAAELLAAWERAFPPPTDLTAHEDRNLLTCARLVVEAALRRTESRGAHFRTDYPAADDGWLRHLAYYRGC